MAGNRKLLEKYLPELKPDEEIYLGGLPHQGDGLTMAVAIGAATDGLIVTEMAGPVCPWLNLELEVTLNPNAIWVNRRGERFAREMMQPFEGGNAVYRQPGKVAFAIMDENIRSLLMEPRAMPGRPVTDADRAAQVEKVNKEFHVQAEKGNIKIAGSLAELADFIGTTPEVFRATVGDYNSFCDKQHDDLFAKDPAYLLALRNPPYYAIRCCLRLLVTHGGIKINHLMEAVDEQDNPIPGLYAAGVETGGTDWGTYNGNLSAHSFGFSIVGGRLAAQNAVAYLTGK
jgi:fumarate reductase flavoprotein subunit